MRLKEQSTGRRSTLRKLYSFWGVNTLNGRAAKTYVRGRSLPLQACWERGARRNPHAHTHHTRTHTHTHLVALRDTRIDEDARPTAREAARHTDASNCGAHVRLKIWEDSTPGTAPGTASRNPGRFPASDRLGVSDP